MYYILVDGKPVEEPDIIKWGKWFHDGDKRKLLKTEIADGVVVSTVFLGLDHNFGEGPPVLWETMVFSGPMDQEQDRYTSEEEARAGHARMVEQVKVSLAPPEPPPTAP